MRVNVSLCAVLRDQPGSCGGDLEVTDGATLADLVQGLGFSQELPVITFVNGRLARGATLLAEDDQVYVFLPVSGG